MRQRVKQRKTVVQEIYSTEKHYLTVLNVLVQVFLKPLRQIAGTEKWVSAEEVRTVFNGIEVLQGCNNSLLEELEKRVAHWTDLTLIGDVFLTLAPYFKMYTNYISTYSQRIETLNGMLKKPEVLSWFNVTKKKSFYFQKFVICNPFFCPFVCLQERYNDEEFSKGRLVKQKIKDLLIQPVQRLPKYALLLKVVLFAVSRGYFVLVLKYFTLKINRS